MLRSPEVPRGNIDFIDALLRENLRLDGRQLNESRECRIHAFKRENEATVEFSLGNTRVCTSAVATVEIPLQDRPIDGFLRFTIDLSPMASREFEHPHSSSLSSTSDLTMQYVRVIEHLYRDTDAFQLESLCIEKSRKVWSIQVHTTVLNHDGSLLDSISMCIPAALSILTLSSSSLSTEEISISRPNHLALHHIPISVTAYSLRLSNSTDSTESDHPIVIDANKQEEEVLGGASIVGVNQFSELCYLSANGECSSQELVRVCKQEGTKRIQWLVTELDGFNKL